MSEDTWFLGRVPLAEPASDLSCLDRIDEDLQVYAGFLVYELQAAFPNQGQIEVHPKPYRNGQAGYNVCLRLPARPPQEIVTPLMVRLTDAVPADLAGRLAGCVTWDNET